MACPRIYILAFLASAVSAVYCRSADSNYETAVDTIPQMSHGKDVSKKFTCPERYGRYPHPENCEYYFECRSGYPSLRHCDRGDLYDEEKEQCKDKRKVKCHIGDEKDEHKHKEDKEDEKETKHFKCPHTWGTFADPHDCSKYFLCLDKVPKPLECYKDFLFDEKFRQCLPRNRVKCGKRLDRDELSTSRRPVTFTTTEKPVETTSKIPITTESQNKFYCPFPNGRYPDPEDCSRYYVCRSSEPRLYTCPNSKLYDEKKEQCMKEKKVKCGGRPGGNDEGVEPVKKDKNIRCPYTWGTFAHPVDCSKYIVCVNNVPAIFSCQKHQLFHSPYRRCLPEEKVSCDDRINPDDMFPTGKTTDFPTFSTLTPSTMKNIPESTTISTTTTITPAPTTTSSTSAPTTRTTTSAPTTTTTTPAPTTRTTTSAPTTTTTTSAPTTRTTTPAPTTTTTTPAPTTTTTTRIPTTVTTTPIPTTTTTTATPSPTTTTTSFPSTTTTTPAPTTTTPVPTTVTVSSTETTVPPTFEPSTESPVTKPNTPPPTDCDEKDLDCIIDETGDVTGWFDCPTRFGHHPHGSSKQLFIHCDNWRPYIKKCADGTWFSPEHLVCVWAV